MSRILLIEDDLLLAQVLMDHLGMEGIGVVHAADGEDALELYKNFLVDIVVVSDTSPPKKNGFELVAEIRDLDPKIPVIMMTGIEYNKENQLKGYRLGVLNYVKKSADMEIILAQIKSAVSMRDHSETADQLEIEGYFLKMNGKAVKLKLREKIVLAALLERKDKTATREELARLIWNSDLDNNYKMLRRVLYLLNKKFVLSEIPLHIKSVYGVGYYLSS